MSLSNLPPSSTHFPFSFLLPLAGGHFVYFALFYEQQQLQQQK